MSEETFSLEQYREAKASGIDLYAQPEVQADAALVEDQVEHDVQDPTEIQDMDVDSDVIDDVEESIEIPEAQKTAFQKALEREKRKANEAAEKKFKEQFETEYSSKFNPYQKFFDQLGLTPEQALHSIEQAKIQKEAQDLAYNNGWSEDQTQMYMRQQDLEKKQTEMTVELQLYQLEETKKYPGIRQMKPAITDFIRKNPSSTVEQAAFAVGGESFLLQIRRESEQKEIAKRSTTPRKVVSDSASSMPSKDVLPPEVIEFMKRERISETQARQLMGEGPRNQTEYREWKAKQGRK